MSASETAATPERSRRLDVATIRKDFPILDQDQNGRRLVFLDSAASSQRPRQVVEAMTDFYNTSYANVHRGVYQLAERSTNAFEHARRRTAEFIGASNPNEIVFTKNATEALNLVAGSWGRANLGPGDAIVLTLLEHHANIVPWQMLAAEKGFEIRWIPVTDDGRLDLSTLDVLLDGAKLVAFTAMSNVTGALTDTDQVIAAARAAGAITVIDACQSVPHLPTDVAALGADFVAFSGHKMLGPTGIGVLWGRSELLEAMPPFLGGGGMILNVTTDGFMPDQPPAKFEAGTPPIAEAVGLAADRLPADHVDQAKQVIGKSRERLRHGTNHTLVALLGATGSGKSSVTNAIVGSDIATTGIRRPTTSSTLGCYWGDDDPQPLLDWLDVPNRHQVAGSSGDEGNVSASPLDGLVLLDVPDHDSVEVSHRLEMERIAEHADLLVWVTDSEKYGDKAMHDYLRRLSHHGAVTAMVLNKIDLLTDDDTKSCVVDLQRLLAEDGLPGAEVMPVSTETGEGIPELRSLLAETVSERSAMIERLRADVTAASTVLLDDLGSSDGLDEVPDRITDQLAAELVGASGIAVVTEAVEAGHRRDAAGLVGWPFTRWARRLRPHPLRRLHLGQGSGGRSSLPQLSGIQLARSENAVRQALATVTADLPEPWPERITEVGTPNQATLNNQLDAVVSEAARTTGGDRRPRWWAAANMLQLALAVAAIVGAVWLALLAFGAYLRLPDVPTPDIAETGVPYPTAMLVGGLLLGVLLAMVFRQMAAVGGRRRADAVRKKAEVAVAGVTRELVIDPVDQELAARSRMLDVLATAADARR